MVGWRVPGHIVLPLNGAAWWWYRVLDIAHFLVYVLQASAPMPQAKGLIFRLPQNASPVVCVHTCRHQLNGEIWSGLLLLNIYQWSLRNARIVIMLLKSYKTSSSLQWWTSEWSERLSRGYSHLTRWPAKQRLLTIFHIGEQIIAKKLQIWPDLYTWWYFSCPHKTASIWCVPILRSYCIRLA